MAKLILALILATSLLPAACASHGTPIMTDPQHVFDYAKRGNWRVRAFVAEAVHEGRISFVGSDQVRIFDRVIMIADIDSVHRSVEVDQGGKTAGAITGGLIGGAIGLLAVEFFRSMGGGCAGTCFIGIVGPAAGAGAVVGMVFGAVVGPAQHQWVRVWKRE